MQYSVPVLTEGDDRGSRSILLHPVSAGGDRFRSQEVLQAGGRTFGGRLVSEALLSASATVDATFLPHSVHAQFLRPGDTAKTTTYSVERLKDGRSFCSRIVRAEQDGELICLVMVSLGLERQGLDRQPDMPAVVSAELLPDEAAARESLAEYDGILGRLFWGREHPVEFRPVESPEEIRKSGGRLNVWFRAKPTFMALDNPVARAALVAYASDRFMMTTSVLPHVDMLPETQFVVASLDHGLWIHRDFTPSGWLLYAIESVTTAGTRTFIRGQIFSEGGEHIASVAQEGLLSPQPRLKSPQS